MLAQWDMKCPVEHTDHLYIVAAGCYTVPAAAVVGAMARSILSLSSWNLKVHILGDADGYPKHDTPLEAC